MNEIRGLGLDIRLHQPQDVGFGEGNSEEEFNLDLVVWTLPSVTVKKYRR